MSAINVILQRSAVHVLVDGACYDTAGLYLAPAVKAWPMPHLGAVVAIRGPRAASIAFADLLSAVSDFEDLRKTIASTMRAVMEQGADYWKHTAGGGDVELVVAGFGRAGPEAYCIASHGDHGAAYALVDLGPVSMVPGDADIEAAVRARLPDGVASAEDMDPCRDGLTILEAQRAAAVQMPDGQRRHIVGGFAQLLTVTKAEITTRILRRWDDVAGEPINSARAA